MLTASERALSAEILKAMDTGKWPAVEADGYSAQLAERRTLKIAPEAFRRKAGDKLFVACARVDVRAARVHFTDAQLEKVGAYDTKLQLRISALPGSAAKQPSAKGRKG